MKKVAVIPSAGIGDGLMMMVAAHRLLMQGYQVTVFHHFLPQLHTWFPGHSFERPPQDKDWALLLVEFDLVLMQNDNSPRSSIIPPLAKELSVFYPSYNPDKYPPLNPLDRIFDPNRPMVDNIAKAIASILRLSHVSKNNGLIPLPGIKYRKYPKRIAIHPTSTAPDRTWHPSGFLKTAKKLAKEGYEPVFCVSPSERADWIWVLSEGFALPLFPTLSDLAEYLYESGYVIGNESGTGHLASNLHIPTLIIAGNQKRMRLWRPGWLGGIVIAPSRFIPNFKGSRLREKHWQHFIFPLHILSQFKKLAMHHSN